MTITLTDELEELVNEKVKSGEYKSADEVVLASLRLLEAREEGMAALRREVMRGIEDFQEGRLTVHTTDEELDAFSDGIIRQGQSKRDASRQA